MKGCDPGRLFVGLLEVMDIAEEEKEVLPITIEEFLKEQKTGAYCKEALATVGHTTSLFT